MLGRSDPGTREGFILVPEAPPNGNGSGNAVNGESRRAELADFLRNRRATLKPEDVGLPVGGRRRTPGLRREEISQLAGVGTTWYTWLEQGRDVRASRDVLDAIGDALKLTPAEHAHLVLLGRGEEVSWPAAPEEEVSPALRRLIHNLGVNPAFILGRRWDYLVWNRAFTVVLGDPEAMPPGRRNQIWATFTDPARRKLMTDWQTASRSSVARFRADHARHLGDPHFDDLIEDLLRVSPDFKRLWSQHEVARSGEGRKVLRHPTAGKLVFEHAVFKREEHTDQRLVLYTPMPAEDTPAKLAELLAAER